MALWQRTPDRRLAPDVVIGSRRLVIRPFPDDAVVAVVEGRRLDDWAPDYPDHGDVVVARLLHDGPPPASSASPWALRQVVARHEALVVGGVGCFGSPDAGELEIGYGVVPSCQGRGYATEAVLAMVGWVWDHTAVIAVTAETEPDHAASQRVLEKVGFRRIGERDASSYLLERPPERRTRR